MTKKTGGLHLRRADSHGVVWLGDGLVTGGSSDLTRFALGRRIAGSGHVDDEQLAEAVAKVSEDAELGLARALRDAGSVDEGELHSIVSEHIVDTVFDLMRWPDGVFEFVVDEPNLDDIGVKRDVDEIVTEARRRIESWGAIDERVANSASVLWLASDLTDDPQLTRDEWGMLALVDGRRTIGDLAALLGTGDYAVAVALTDLVGRGLIQTSESEGAASMARRQELMASLETGSPEAVKTVTTSEPESQPASEPLAAVETIETVESVDMVDSHDDDEAEDDETDGVMAEVSELHSRELSSVTPQRPEPFMPSREPDHPEPLAAAVAGGGAMAAPLAAIERDPSVNKSLLLRLIAGVRGL
jgi:hypothetical protein